LVGPKYFNDFLFPEIKGALKGGKPLPIEEIIFTEAKDKVEAKSRN
jgi:hypothetical protein